MRTRTLGRSGVDVPEIGLGTWGLSGEGYGPVAREDARRALGVAIEEGCTFFETADCYAEGGVESLIGDVLAVYGRNRVFVSTRIGVDRSGELTRKNFAPKYLTAACERSLQRLRTDYVDALVLHNPQVGTLTLGDAWRCLEALKASGKTRTIGVSVSTVEAGEAAAALAPDLLVLPYNLFFSQLLHRLASVLSAGSIGVVARSPYGYGILADTWGASRRFRDDDHRVYRWGSADLTQRVKQREALRPLLDMGVPSLRALALRYVLANQLVTVTVPGARTPEHVRENAHLADTLPYLPDKILSTVGQYLRDAGVDT